MLPITMPLQRPNEDSYINESKPFAGHSLPRCNNVVFNEGRQRGIRTHQRHETVHLPAYQTVGRSSHIPLSPQRAMSSVYSRLHSSPMHQPGTPEKVSPRPSSHSPSSLLSNSTGLSELSSKTTVKFSESPVYFSQLQEKFNLTQSPFYYNHSNTFKSLPHDLKPYSHTNGHAIKMSPVSDSTSDRDSKDGISADILDQLANEGQFFPATSPTRHPTMTNQNGSLPGKLPSKFGSSNPNYKKSNHAPISLSENQIPNEDFELLESPEIKEKYINKRSIGKILISHSDRKAEDIAQCEVIITCGSVLWILLSIANCLLTGIACFSPNWLIGELQVGDVKLHDTPRSPSVGPLIFCYTYHLYKSTERDCDYFLSYSTDTGLSSSLPSPLWKLSLLCLMLALGCLIIAAVASLFSIQFHACCLPFIKHKSLFTLTGVVQGVAGLLLVLGTTSFSAGWSSSRVRILYCGEKASYFIPGTCKLGTSFYLILLSIILCLVSAIGSVVAEKSVRSHRVQVRRLRGQKYCICTL